MVKNKKKYEYSFKSLLAFFPIRLLLLHLRRSWLLLFFWFLLFGTVGGYFFSNIGIPYLFQTPEYLHEVSPTSYLIMGVVLGLFVMAFHISSYIFYSYRFPFLATLSRPLYVFSINNSIIPIVFYLYYTTVVIGAMTDEKQAFFQVLISLAALYFGSVFSIGLSLTYFFSTNKTLHIDGMEGLEKPLRAIIRKDKSLEKPETFEGTKVRTYLKNYYRIRLTRKHAHYSQQQKLDTLQKHHVNAAIFFLSILAVVVILSMFILKPLFQIPAGASILLIFTLYIMVIGAVYSRFKTWTMFISLLLFIGLNYLSGLEQFQRLNRAFGLDYSTKAEYNIEVLDSLTHPLILENDKLHMHEALKNWRAKFPENSPPKLVVLNSSGGGLRATLWSLGMLQKLDSTMGGDFLENVFIITGSSGGMLGSAYYRELKYREKQKEKTAVNHKDYYNRMGKDMLNAVGASLAMNDLFFALKKVEVGGRTYRMDRGYAWEKRLIEITDSILDRRIVDYHDLEFTAQMPLMVLSPMVINDGRRMLISPHGMSFLARNYSPYSDRTAFQIDGIDFQKFFHEQDAGELRFTTALRMSATFPYITPLVSLPSNPRMELIDAGARDNDGFNLGLRFLSEFKDWIADNTSGVMVIKLMANSEQTIRINESPFKTRLDALTKPITGVLTSFNNLQEFDYSSELRIAEQWVDFPLDIYSLELLNKGDDISLSWHLTSNEKEQIYNRTNSDNITRQLEEIREKLKLDQDTALVLAKR